MYMMEVQYMSTNYNPYEKLSIRDWSFWDIWIQKLLRNVASVKYQLLILYSTIIVTGMFFEKTSTGEPFIGAAAGLAFLGGGMVTLISTRLAARTTLFAPKGDEMDTDR